MAKMKKEVNWWPRHQILKGFCIFLKICSSRNYDTDDIFMKHGPTTILTWKIRRLYTYILVIDFGLAIWFFKSVRNSPYNVLYYINKKKCDSPLFLKVRMQESIRLVGKEVKVSPIANASRADSLAHFPFSRTMHNTRNNFWWSDRTVTK